MKFSYIFYIILGITFLHLFFYQIKSLDTKNPENCLTLFKSNNIFGLLVYLNLLSGKLF